MKSLTILLSIFCICPVFANGKKEISGKCYQNGRAVKGEEIVLERNGKLIKSTRTDENGRYEFEVPKGSYTVKPSSKVFRYYPPFQNIVLKRQNERRNHFYRLSKPAPRPAPKPAPRPAPKPAPRPAPKPAPKPAPRPAPKPAPRPAPKPAPRPAPKPAPKPAPRPAPKPAPRLVKERLSPSKDGSMSLLHINDENIVRGVYRVLRPKRSIRHRVKGGAKGVMMNTYYETSRIRPYNLEDNEVYVRNWSSRSFLQVDFRITGVVNKLLNEAGRSSVTSKKKLNSTETSIREDIDIDWNANKRELRIVIRHPGTSLKNEQVLRGVYSILAKSSLASTKNSRNVSLDSSFSPTGFGTSVSTSGKFVKNKALISVNIHQNPFVLNLGSLRLERNDSRFSFVITNSWVSDAFAHVTTTVEKNANTCKSQFVHKHSGTIKRIGKAGSIELKANLKDESKCKTEQSSLLADLLFRAEPERFDFQGNRGTGLRSEVAIVVDFLNVGVGRRARSHIEVAHSSRLDWSLSVSGIKEAFSIQKLKGPTTNRKYWYSNFQLK